MKIALSTFHMSYQDQGNGTPLLLLHGYPLNSRMWQPQIDNLADNVRLIVPDLRGHGDSEATDGAYSMELHASDCNELLEALSIHEKVIVCGLSMGGYIALAFYRLYPEKVAGLILASTRAAADSPEARANRDQAILLARTNGVRAIAEGMAPRLLSAQTMTSQPQLGKFLVELMAHNSVEAVVGDLQGMRDRIDSMPWLAAVQVPVQIIHGVEDQVVPLDEAMQMQALIPRVKLCTIPAAAHLPNLEQPALFNNCVRTFLEQYRK